MHTVELPSSLPGRAGGRGSSAGSCRITSCAIVTGAQARGTTRARWRVWWALPGATSWCRCRALPVGKRSICGSREQCRRRQDDILRGHRETIGERLVRDLAAMAAAAAAPFEACAQAPGQVSSQSPTTYSVPVAYGHRDVWVRGYVDRVVIGCGGEVIARHPRSYEREDTIFEPIHYLPLIEQKIGALDQAPPLAGWDLPPVRRQNDGTSEAVIQRRLWLILVDVKRLACDGPAGVFGWSVL